MTNTTTPPGAALRGKALEGAAWIAASQPLGILLRLGRSLLLTRLLFPEAFGLMALVEVVLSGLQMLSDVGIGPSIVQHKRSVHPEARFLQTAWTIQVCRGVGLWILACALAWPASVFYEQPELLALMPVSGLNILIGGFSSAAVHTMQRDLDVRRATLFRYGVHIATIVVVLTLAWLLESVWALVFGSLVGTMFFVVASHLFLPRVRHRFVWDGDSAKEIIAFGRWIFVSTTLTFLGTQLDILLLGKLIPADLLGVYRIALVLAMTPREFVIRLSGEIVFPALSEEARRDRSVLNAKLRKARSHVLDIGVVVVVGVALWAPAFFQYLYDSRYWAAGWMAQLLTFRVWSLALQHSSETALLASGDSRSMAAANLAKLVGTFVAAMLGHHLFGVGGLIVGVGAGALAGHCVVAIRLRRHGVFVLPQDARETLRVVTWVGLGFGISQVLGLVDALEGVALANEMIAGVLICVPLSLSVLRRSWREIKGR